MPEICRFYGIIIRMFWADHPPPHFHAVYGEYEAVIDILTSEILEASCHGEHTVWLVSGLTCTIVNSWNCESRQGSLVH